MAQFASDYGIGESQLFNWLKREDPPLAKHWPKLAEFFGVSPAYIASGTPEKVEPPAEPEREATLHEPPASYGARDEQQSAYGTPELIERELRREIDLVIEAANRDPERLHWIAVQVREYLSIPKSWRDPRARRPGLGVIQPRMEKGQRLPSPSDQSRSA